MSGTWIHVLLRAELTLQVSQDAIEVKRERERYIYIYMYIYICIYIYIIVYRDIYIYSFIYLPLGPSCVSERITTSRLISARQLYIRMGGTQ